MRIGEGTHDLRLEASLNTEHADTSPPTLETMADGADRLLPESRRSADRNYNMLQVCAFP